jgi:hypothetical protein
MLIALNLKTAIATEDTEGFVTTINQLNQNKDLKFDRLYCKSIISFFPLLILCVLCDLCG